MTGLLSWVFAGVAALVVARWVPYRKRQIVLEGLISILTAFLAGVLATRLDFGGWNELDWRAVTFAMLCGFSAIAVLRIGNGEWRMKNGE